jgi:hypothetical protein
MRAIRVHSIVAGRPARATYRILAGSSASEGQTTLDPDHRQIHFWGGDAAVGLLQGSWSCVDNGRNTAITFAARLDLGDPSGDDPRETLAVDRLVDNAVARLVRLFPGLVRVDDVVIQVHRPVATG